jgi:Tfp pilus assembly PilM family ATPase
MATLLGIDLGNHSVKLAFMEGRLGRMGLTEFRQRRVRPEGDGPATLEDKVRALSLLLSEGVDASVQVMGYPTEQVSIRFVEMPFSDPGQIQKTLPFELEGHVPFDLDDFVLDYRVVTGGRGARLSAEGKSLVLCGMAEQSAAAHFLECVEAAGADPRHVVLDAEMLGHLANGNSVQLIVDVGHERSLLAFCSGGEVLGVRAINQGGAALTRALQEAFGWSESDAEGQKHTASVNPLDLQREEADSEDTKPIDRATPSEIAKVLTLALDPLLAELRTTVFSFEGRHGLELEELLLTGGGSHLNGLSTVIGRSLNVATRSVSVSDEARSLGAPGRFSIAHGLALRAAGVKGSNAFDFRKGDLAHPGNLALGRNLLRYGAVAMLFFAIGGSVLYGMKRSGLKGEINTVQDEIIAEVAAQFPDLPPSALEGDGKAFTTLLAVASDVGERVNVLEGTAAGQPPTLLLIKELSEAMPSPSDARVEVTSMTISESSIYFKAKTTGYEAAATIEQAIQSKERFKDATKGDEKKSGSGLSFSITIPLDQGEEEEG